VKRKIFFWLAATVLLTTASLAEAPQPTKVARIGYLSRAEAIRLALRVAT